MNKKKHISKKADRENEAMNWYNKIQNTQYEREEYEFSSYDGVLSSGNTQYLSEIKVRENYSNEQIEAFGGSFLEFKKLNGIINHKNAKDDYRQILYFVFLKDRVNVYRLNPDPNYYMWELKWLQKNDFDSNKEWKHIAKLSKQDIIKTIKYK